MGGHTSRSLQKELQGLGSGQALEARWPLAVTKLRQRAAWPARLVPAAALSHRSAEPRAPAPIAEIWVLQVGVEEGKNLYSFYKIRLLLGSHFQNRVPGVGSLSRRPLGTPGNVTA